MSVPAAIGAALPSLGAGAAAALNPIDLLMASVNSNPYFIGLMMLILNLGGRFLSLEVTKEQEKFLSNPTVRRFFLFVVLFVGTRNIVIAAGLTIIVILCIGYLFNENSDLCLWRSCLTPVKEESDTPSQDAYAGLTAEEVMILKRLQDKQQAAAKPKEDEHAQPQPEPITASGLYSHALSFFH